MLIMMIPVEYRVSTYTHQQPLNTHQQPLREYKLLLGPKQSYGEKTRSRDSGSKWHGKRSGDPGTSQRLKQKIKNAGRKHRGKVGPSRRMLCRRRAIFLRRASKS
jgi:hypothetical protein